MLYVLCALRIAKGKSCWEFRTQVYRKDGQSLSDRNPRLITLLGMKIMAAGLTHVGNVRENNEDSFCVDLDLGLFVVADGMGGHASGEVASNMAVRILQEGYRKFLESNVPHQHDSLIVTASRVLDTISMANREIYLLSQQHPRHRGMGTTLAGLAISGNYGVQFHVGDSRIYRLREGTFSQLTEDHSLVAHQVRLGLLNEVEARTSRAKNIITRALGVQAAVEVDLEAYLLRASDLYLLCTDGLSDLVPKEVMSELLQLYEKEPTEACKALISEALWRGGYDNVTVVVVRIE